MSFDLNISCGVDDFEDSLTGSVARSAVRLEHPPWSSENSESRSIDLNTSPCENVFGEEENQAEDISVGEGDEDAHRFSNVEGDETAADACSVQVCREVVEGSIRVGCFVETLDEVHVLYREYGRLTGFSVRKGKQCYFQNTRCVRAKIYVCSCEGEPDNKASVGKVPVCKKQSYRCNCNAKLRVARDDPESPFRVTIFDDDHNHDMVDPRQSYLLRSARNMSESKKILLVALTSSGIGVSRAYRFMENEAGSRANVGFLRKDAYNTLNSDRRKLYKAPNSDVNTLIEHFTAKGLTDPSFYWKVKVGEDGRMQNLFFRDSRCLVDYQHFGDVVSIDATYKTNKYDLVCVPIIGINHHRTNVLFGMAFLVNEKTASYEWLFSSFLESMYGKEPTVIFSDQDQALMNGLDSSFREATHRLCQWHINKNAGKQFGKLNHNRQFKSLWHGCMNGCENEEEFETTWQHMIDEFNLVHNRWFKNMYKLRKRWSSAFSLDKFCGGLHATSRSEVTNKVIKELCGRTSSVFEFVLGFEKTLKNWRTREFEEDALCRGMPGTFVERTGLVKQLGELCTRTIFKIMESEVLKSITVRMMEEPPDVNVQVTQFKLFSSAAMKGFRVVTINQETKWGTCSCRMWETEGIICRHLFKVFFNLNIDKLPDEMILNRWRRDSKERIPLSERAIDSAGPNNFKNMVFVNYNMRRVYELLSDCKDNTKCRDAINEHLSSMVGSVRSLMKRAIHEPKETLHRPIRNPMEKKKRSSRRKMYSSSWERGVRAQEPSTLYTCEDLEDELRSNFPVDDSPPSYGAASPDRFSVD